MPVSQSHMERAFAYIKHNSLATLKETAKGTGMNYTITQKAVRELEKSERVVRDRQYPPRFTAKEEY